MRTMVAIGLLALVCMLNSSCAGGGSGNTAANPGGGGGGGGASTQNQVWLLDFGPDPHVNGRREQAKVIVTAFTNSGTFSETSDSPGVIVYNPDGSCNYRITVGGTVSHAGTYDSWSFSGMAGAGCGMQSQGRGSGNANGAFPDATNVNGSMTLTTTSPLGTVSPSGNWSGTRQ